MPKQKSTLLIAEDMPENIDFLYNLLKEDYELKVATNGKKALDLILAGAHPDLILLDIVMPVMNGYETIKELHKNLVTKNIPVIFLTTNDKAEDIVKGIELGAVDYVTKPFNSSELLARVQTHLELKHTRDELKKQNQILEENLKLREDIDSISKHDLKNPLTSVLNYLELTGHMKSNPDKVEDYVKKAQNSCWKILDMINRSLDLYKMEKGIYQYNPVKVDIIKLLNNIFLMNQSIASPKNIRFEFLINDNVVQEGREYFFEGEELLFFSLFSNLIRNAIDASSDNEKITINIKDNNIEINNNGAVPGEIKDRFFDKYVSSGKQRGTGLGTYSAKLITETLRGKIEMKSSLQEGTTITIIFP